MPYNINVKKAHCTFVISWNEGYMVYFKREQTQFKELTNFAGVCRQYHMFKVLFYAAVGWEALAPGFRRIMQRESSDSPSTEQCTALILEQCSWTVAVHALGI